jgi:hypothetical protein
LEYRTTICFFPSNEYKEAVLLMMMMVSAIGGGGGFPSPQMMQKITFFIDGCCLF